jgi:hypothetical protein
MTRHSATATDAPTAAESVEQLRGELEAWLQMHRHSGNMVKTIERKLKLKAGATAQRKRR